MKRLFAIVITTALVAIIVCPASAISPGDRALQTFDIHQSVSLALGLTQRAVQARLTTQLAFYHPMSVAAVNATTDVKTLRSQLLAAQQAAEISRDTVATLTTDQANTALSQLSAGLALALTAPTTKAAIFSVPNSTNVIAVFDPNNQGTAPAVSPAKSNTCKVMSYITSAYSTGSPQFVTSAGSTGQKNTLSIAGFALGIIPIALACADDHSTKNPANGS